MHLLENAVSALGLWVKVARDYKFWSCYVQRLRRRYIYKKMQFLTFTLVAKITCNVAQYPLHRVTYATTKFEVATSNGLGEDAFTRKYIIWLKDLSIDEMVGTWCFGCLSGPPGFTCWISFALVFSLIYCWVLFLALSPCYILIYMF